MSVFSKIVAGDIPCHKIAENDLFLAFLDIEPLKDGHVLVIPKVETDYIFDCSDDELQQWLLFARPIAAAIKKAFPCKKVGMSVIGLEVPYAHMHLVPINSADDLNFTRPKMSPSMEHLDSVKKKIIGFLD